MPQLLVPTLKAMLRGRGVTYADVARELDLSESSVKRMFSHSASMPLDRFVAIAKLAGYSLSEVAKAAENAQPKTSTLTVAQERELVADPKLLLVAVCALNNWTLADIVGAYRVSETECIERLCRLDRLHLIELMPGNRIRLAVARNFAWLPNGPITKFFRAQWQHDFLDAPFAEANEDRGFAHGMLTSEAAAEIKADLAAVRCKFAQLHDDARSLPLVQRRGMLLFTAMRPWEPAEFAGLRR